MAETEEYSLEEQCMPGQLDVQAGMKGLQGFAAEPMAWRSNVCLDGWTSVHDIRSDCSSLPQILCFVFKS